MGTRMPGIAPCRCLVSEAEDRLEERMMPARETWPDLLHHALQGGLSPGVRVRPGRCHTTYVARHRFTLGLRDPQRQGVGERTYRTSQRIIVAAGHRNSYHHVVLSREAAHQRRPGRGQDDLGQDAVA